MAVEPGIAAEAGEVIDCAGRLVSGPADRPPRPSRRGADREPGAQRLRHATRGHCRLGPAEGAPRPRIGEGAGEAGDRLGGGPGRGLHPHPRRYLGTRGQLSMQALLEVKDEVSDRVEPAGRGLPAGRHPLPPRRAGALPPRARHGAGRNRWHPPQRGDAGGGRRQPQADLRRGGEAGPADRRALRRGRRPRLGASPR